MRVGNDVRAPSLLVRRPGRALRACLCAAGLIVAFAPSASAERARIDGIAAIVGGSAPRQGTLVLYASDVELEAWLDRAHHEIEVGEGAPPLTRSELADARERLVGHALLAYEAARLRIDDVDEERLSAAWRRFFELHGGARTVEVLVARLGLGNDELERYVRREAIARGFVIASSEQGGIVTDAEIEDAWQRGDHPYVGMDLDTVREAFRALLLERRVDDETVRWIERLRMRIPVGGRAPS